jgi:hypothetical protein
MSVTVSAQWKSSTMELRLLCGVLAAVVAIDAAVVRAPGLGLLAVPFLVAAVAYRGRKLGATVVAAFALLMAGAGGSFAVQTGFDAGWGDLLFAYVGTPVALLAAVMAVMRLFAHR